MTFYPSIHLRLSFSGLQGAMEPIPAVLGREAGNALDCRRANKYTQTTIRTHIPSRIHTYGQFRVSS